MSKADLGNLYFDKYTTNVIKGISLTLMFFHHFFTFPSWWPVGISYPYFIVSAKYLCSPSKICVSIFCFITGYVYAYNQNKTLRYSIKKISLLLLSYWIVFFSLAAVAKFGLHYDYTLLSFIKECFALYRPTMIFCWYVFFYVFFMLLIPIMVRWVSINFFIDFVLLIMGIPVAFHLLGCRVDSYSVSQIFESLYLWLPSVLIGYLFARYNLFRLVQSMYIRFLPMHRLRLIVSIIMLAIVPMGRYILPGVTLCLGNAHAFFVNLDVVYAPLFVFLLVDLLKNIHVLNIRFIFSKIGEKSMLMWFLSCAFFGNCKMIFQPILYAPKNPILVLIWGLLICYLFACIFSFVVDKILYVINQMKVALRLRINKLQ